MRSERGIHAASPPFISKTMEIRKTLIFSTLKRRKRRGSNRILESVLADWCNAPEFTRNRSSNSID